MYGKIFFLFLVFHYSQSALIELSCSDIDAFVEGHNAARLELAEGKVDDQPPAAEMNSMVWDEELAEKAEKWASSYPNSIDPDETIPSHRFSISQSVSVFISENRSFKVDPEELQKLWFNEHQNYTYGPFTKEMISPSHPPVGHYIQMIWSNSIYLGCAMSEKVTANLKKVYVVCEYGPSANILGQVPYKSGAPSNKLICADENRCDSPSASKCYED